VGNYATVTKSDLDPDERTFERIIGNSAALLATLHSKQASCENIRKLPAERSELQSEGKSRSINQCHQKVSVKVLNTERI
jgi:hypothetical protein